MISLSKYLNIFIYNIILLVLSSNGNIIDNEKINYYMNLINNERKASFNYKIPKYSEEFEIKYNANETRRDPGDYDFIIVGAGSAGAVVASRLAEIPDWNILLLEAGEDETDYSEIPDETTYLFKSKMNWGYYTTSQNNSCQSMEGNKCFYPRGKALGGSSAVNAMIYIRGNSHDFDSWSKAGVTGWSYKDVLPYFKKSENCLINADVNYHGFAGPLDVVYGNPPAEILPIWFQAHKELGINKVEYNGKHQIGVSKMQITTRHGRRWSTNKAYLQNVKHHNNLKILTESLATKIVIDNNKKVKGVTFIRKGRKYVASMKKELILCAGSLNTPKLLMLSGIGPKDELNRHGIEVKIDLPVGQNLQDHPSFIGLNFKTNFTIKNKPLRELVEEYLNGYGSLTRGAFHSSVGFIPDPANPSVALLNYILYPPDSSTFYLSNQLHYKKNLMENYFEKFDPTTDVRININLLHPESVGKLSLQSKNPLDFPLYDLNIFSQDIDFENMRYGINYIMKLLKTDSLKSINAEFIDYPVCKEFIKFSDEFWNCAIRIFSDTYYHAIRSTPMGNEKISVVDSKLKVYNVENLRIADAGIIPFPTSGHMNAPLIMIGEKAADIIKENYGKL